jgi:branched-chain amino acid transport system permease protein
VSCSQWVCGPYAAIADRAGLDGIREDETAAIAMGIPLVRMKLLAFAVGASFAGMMGVIFASKQLFINPPTFDLLRSIGILSMVILGGMGSIPGVILGAVLVTLLDLQILPRIADVLRDAQQAGLPIPSPSTRPNTSA